MLTIADSERKVIPLRDEFDPQVMRKKILDKGLEFLEEHNFRMGILTWQSELNKGADLPNVADINRYFGSWAVFNSVVRNTYRDPGFEFNPKESELKGYAPTQLPERELNMRPNPAGSVLEKKVIEAPVQEQESAKPKPVLVGRKARAEDARPKSLNIPVLPPIEEFVPPPETIKTETAVPVEDIVESAICRMKAEVPPAPTPEQSFEKKFGQVLDDNKDVTLVSEETDHSYRRPSALGIGSVAALLILGLSFKGDSVQDRSVPVEAPVKPVKIESPAPTVKADLLEQVGVVADDTIIVKYNPADKKITPVPKIDSPPEKMPDNSQWTPLVYRNVVDIVRSSRPKSLVPEYNLSPDAKDLISVQGVINTAFYEGTRLYSDDEEMHWNGGLNTVAQRLLAERWVAEYVGADLEELTWHRDEEFDESFIDADTADLAIVPGYVNKEKKTAPKPSRMPQDGTGVESYRKKAESDKKDSKLPTTGHLQLLDGGRKDPAEFDIDESPAYESYTPEQRETIATLYAEMRFGKEFEENEMSIMGFVHGIEGLTTDIAEDIYFEQKSGVSMQREDSEGSRPLDYRVFELRAA